MKDHQSYKTEKTQLEEKIEKLRAEGTEEGVLKRYEQDLADTIAMLPKLKSKIEEGVDGLCIRFDAECRPDLGCSRYGW